MSKGTYTTGALDNVYHNPFSTSADGLFHGSRISIIQTLEFKNEGKNCILLFETVSTDIKIELPDKFTFVKAVSINQITIEVPLKSIQKRKVNVNDELVKETELLDSNISNLSNNYEKGKEKKLTHQPL